MDLLQLFSLALIGAFAYLARNTFATVSASRQERAAQKAFEDSYYD